MLILIMAILIILMIVFAILDEKSNLDFTPDILMIFTGSAILICGIAMLVLGIKTTQGNVIDDKIAMYQEENTAIENQINDLVSQYMEYEGNTFEKFKSESSVTLVSMYPELKSDSLVSKQIEVYMANNEKIKELKNDKLNQSVYRFWLYFGK